MNQKTLELMAKLTERLSDPNQRDDSRETLMMAIQALDYALTPPGQPAIHGKFEVTSSKIQGQKPPDFTLQPGPVLPDSPNLPDFPDLSPARSPRPAPSKIVYRPPTLLERITAVVTGGLGLATEKTHTALVNADLPEGVTAGDLVRTAIDVGLNGPGRETHRVSPLTLEEQIAATNAEIALAILRGDYRPPEPKTERDRARLETFQADAEKYGTAHALGSSMFDWL